MAGYNGRTRFTATIHTEPGAVPPRFWRLIGLRYPDGRSLCLVYTAEPADSSELPRLMWQLQCAAAVYSFTITVTDADGTSTQAPADPAAVAPGGCTMTVYRPGFIAHPKPAGRKHYWMPCVINDTFDKKTPEEQDAILKATKWADPITNAQWPVVLGHENAPKHERSRLKKKLLHWLMAMGRIAALNPELFDQALREARDLYREQLGQDHPLMGQLTVGEFAGDHLLFRIFDRRAVADSVQPPCGHCDASGWCPLERCHRCGHDGDGGPCAACQGTGWRS